MTTTETEKKTFGREYLDSREFNIERDAILDAVHESIDKELYMKLRKETPEEDKVKLSFAVTVDPVDKTVQAVMSASLKMKQEGFADWSGLPLLDYIEQKERGEAQ